MKTGRRIDPTTLVSHIAGELGNALFFSFAFPVWSVWYRRRAALILGEALRAWPGPEALHEQPADGDGATEALRGARRARIPAAERVAPHIQRLALPYKFSTSWSLPLACSSCRLMREMRVCG